MLPICRQDAPYMSPECSLYVAEMFPICRQTMLGDVDSQMVRWPLIIYNNDYIRISNTRLKFKFLLRIRDRRSFRGGAALWKIGLLEGERIGGMGIFSILGGG